MTMYHDPFVGPIWITKNSPEKGSGMIVRDYGTFEVEMLSRGYSVHHYTVRKVSGEWPSKREIAEMCDGISLDYFGFEAFVGDDTASVNIFVD